MIKGLPEPKLSLDMEDLRINADVLLLILLVTQVWDRNASAKSASWHRNKVASRATTRHEKFVKREIEMPWPRGIFISIKRIKNHD